MAERRMFTRKITDSDAFTGLPPTTQALYFHMCMSADDDGFNNKIRQAMFNAHADSNDFNLLVQHRFIIPFNEKGVVVIKHWRMHNIIRSDRYHKTEYVEEMATLILKKNGAYTDSGIPSDNQVTTNGIPNDNQMETEDRIGKDRIGKESIESSLHSDSLSDRVTDYDEIKSLWNELDGCGDIKAIRSINGKRKDSVRARIKEYGVDGFREAIDNIKRSDFLQGKHGGNPWVIDFDWFVRPNNFPKVLEGKYENTQSKTSKWEDL